MLDIAVLVSGGGTNLQAIMDAIKNGAITGARVKAVISSNPDAFALERAKSRDIDTFCVSPKAFDSRSEFYDSLIKTVDGCAPGLIVLAGYLVVLPPELIRRYPGKIINVHPSLIPSFCGKGFYGLKVHEEALKRGVKVTGATVHFVDEGTDSGPIIAQKAVEVREGDTPRTLQRRVMEQAEWVLLPKVINDIANGRLK